MLRTAHGKAAALGALVTVETAPPDELPPGVPAEPTGPIERRHDGTVTAEGARELGRRGGRITAERRRFAALLADQLGLAEVGPALESYVEPAKEYAEAHMGDLAQSVGGGRVGPGPASVIQSAALALAASRYMYAEGSKTGDAKLLGQAARLGDQSRAALLTAHELAAREATARKAAETVSESELARRVFAVHEDDQPPRMRSTRSGETPGGAIDLGPPPRRTGNRPTTTTGEIVSIVLPNIETADLADLSEEQLIFIAIGTLHRLTKDNDCPGLLEAQRRVSAYQSILQAARSDMAAVTESDPDAVSAANQWAEQAIATMRKPKESES